MAKTPKTAPREAAASPAEKLYDVLIERAWEPALRFALELEGAPQKCSRRACRTSRMCHLEWKEGEPVGCADDAMSEKARRMAAVLVHFGSIMVIRYLEDVVIPERMETVRRFGGGAR